jgi:gamma-glutamyltranspeptidase/glutathione hydrolase
MKARWLVLAAIALGCKRSPPPPAPEVDPKQITWPAPTPDAAPAPEPIYRAGPPPIDPKNVGTAKTFMVTAESIEGATVGRDILAKGGNAVDAAVGIAFAIAVTHPTAGNIGGGGFAVVRIGPGKFTALDFRETAPAAATENMFLDQDGKATEDSRIGHRASGVPGAVAGLYELHRKHGSKPWKELVEPSVQLARNGFTLDDYVAKALARPTTRAKLEKFPATKALWFDGDNPRGAGEVVKLPELAVTLERIRDRGPDGFYKGETAKAIVDEMKQGGGIITAEDLTSYKAIWREPLKFGYRGKSIVSMPPPSSGGIMIGMTAGLLRGVELGKLAWHGADHVHRLAEIWRRAFFVRNEALADPAFAKDIPVAKFLSTGYLDKLAATITTKATKSKAVPKLIESLHTTHLCVVDSKGMAVALTTTLNGSFGSGVTVVGGGFFLNNEMDDFAAKPGSPNMFGLVQSAANKIEPGKRMLSSMSPMIVEDDQGALVMVVGAEGGSKIITAVWQTLSNVIDFGMPVGRAIAEPRIHQQDFPEQLKIEAGAIDKDSAEALTGMGHEITWGEAPANFGGVNAIVKTPNGLEGGVDPRRRGAALGD